MSKYMAVQDAVYGVFASAEWQLEDIKTIPANYTQTITEERYIRVNIVMGRSLPVFSDMDPLSGLLMIDIFVQSGKGTRDVYDIADILDSCFSGATHTSLQFSASSLTLFGKDKDNSTLFRGIYSIPFAFYGA